MLMFGRLFTTARHPRGASPRRGGAFREPVEPIPPATTALVALNAQHIELADQVAEDDGAFAGHVANAGPVKGGYVASRPTFRTSWVEYPHNFPCASGQ